MSLSTDDQARLASLRAARDKLLTGTNTVRVSSDAGDVVYGTGDLANLRAEIQQLEAKDTSTTGRTRGALRFRVR
jgi:hypothetical protein